MKDVHGVGIGWRRSLTEALLQEVPEERPSFIELSPENWMQMGGYWRKQIKQMSVQYPILCHGLSLSIGSPDPLDHEFLTNLKSFLREVPVSLYSEHLSYSQVDNAHLYDLFPIPFTQEAIDHIVPRIKEVQDILERPIALENISYYTPIAAEMDEATFVSEIINQSGCLLLLDINNVYVNAFNHNYKAKEFIQALPLEKVAYIHMAGHDQVAPDLLIDTHGSPISDPVYDLFAWTLDYIDPVPILLERDFNIPKWSELKQEVQQLQTIVETKWHRAHVS